MFRKKKDMRILAQEHEKIGWDDLLAIMIAEFQILFPLAIGAVVIISLLLLFFMKVWLKQ